MDLEATSLARSLDEVLSEYHESEKFVKFYPDQYNLFENEGSELEFSIEILTVKYNFPHCLYLKS